MTGLQSEVEARIAASGPMSLHDYMAACNAHYYATRDPLGAAGDFITAPEISQMFGELVGAWLADLWRRAGKPAAAYVELGPGRGTLAADALRVLARAGSAPPVHFVETSPVLREAQARAAPAATWHESIDTLPADLPLLVVANEFFDALPVRQLVRTEGGWRERMLGHGLMPQPGNEDEGTSVPQRLRQAPPGSIFETSPASLAVTAVLARRVAAQGGALLVIDYGHTASAIGDTLQAVRRHAFADPFVRAGEIDLTAHADFEALGEAAQAAGVRRAGPVAQGIWLRRLGIDSRAAALARAYPADADALAEARARLVDDDRMGALFKVMALTAAAWPAGEGFGA